MSGSLAQLKTQGGFVALANTALLAVLAIEQSCLPNASTDGCLSVGFEERACKLFEESFKGQHQYLESCWQPRRLREHWCDMLRI